MVTMLKRGLFGRMVNRAGAEAGMSRRRRRDKAESLRPISFAFPFVIARSPERATKQSLGLLRLARNDINIVLSFYLIFWCSSAIYAQEQKIIVTTNQQYQNMARNASFESWSAGTTAIPDAWTGVNGPSYTKLTNDKMFGANSLKVTASASGQGVSQPVTVDPNNTYTVSFYYKVDTGGSVTFNLSGVSALINQTGLNSTSWKRIGYSFDTTATDNSVIIKMTANGAYSFYLDGIMLTKGPQAPGYMDYSLTDIGDQAVYGDIKVQDISSANNILLDKDTGNITLTGTLDGRDVSIDGAKLDGISAGASDTTNDSWTGTGDVYTVSGNVGIGTTAPDQPLTIAGAFAGYGLHVDSSSGAGIEIDRGGTTNSHGVLFQTAGVDDYYIGNYNQNDGLYIKEGGYGGTTLVSILSGGNVGIGTTAPGLHKLYVKQDTAQSAMAIETIVGQNALNLMADNGSTGARHRVVWSSRMSGSGAYIEGYRNNASFDTAMELVLGAAVQGANDREQLRLKNTELVVNDASYDLDFRVESDNNAGAFFVQGSDGNVGIGTTNPLSKFQVSGDSDSVLTRFYGGATDRISMYHDSASDIFRIYHWDDTAAANQPIALGNNQLVVLGNTGNVGIGTTGPGARLHVAAGNVYIDNTEPEIRIRRSADVNNYLRIHQDGAFARIQQSYNNPLALQPTSGNVGIGTTGPAEKLEIASGNLKVGGAINATGAITGSNLIGTSSGTNTGDQTISLTGDVVGTGTGAFETTIQANAVALGADTTGNYVASLTEGSDIDITNPSGEGVSPTINIESQLDNVSTISQASSNLTLQTTASGHIILSPAGNVGIGTTGPGNKLTVVGNIEIGASSGTGVNPMITNPNNIANFAITQFYPASGTNVNSSFTISPRGTGVANNRAQLSVFGTDYIADSTNYEFGGFRATGSSFVVGTGHSGTGADRQLILSSGYLSGANLSQLVLDTTGNVGIGTTAPSQALELGPSKWLSFEGATDDAYETIIQVTDPTADKTITLPNASGEVTLLGQTIALGTETTGTYDSTADTIADDGVIELTTETSGNYVGDVSSGSGITVTGTPGEGYAETVKLGGALTDTSTSLTHTSTAANNPLVGITITPNAATDVTQNVLKVSSAVSTSATDTTVDSLILLDNADTAIAGSTVVIDAIKINSSGMAGGVIDAIDVSAENITNAINIGANDIITAGATISSVELDRLDGKDDALIDANDAVATLITGVGTLGSLTVSGETSSGSLTVGGGYGFAGITLEADGDILIDGDITQASGKKYMSDATLYTGDYEIADTLKIGVGAAGTDLDYLMVATDGTISKLGASPSGDVKIDDSLTVTGAVTWTGGSSANANTAYSDRLKWDGGDAGLIPATGRTSLGLGGLATLSAVSGGTGGTITDGTITNADISSGAILKAKLNELRPHAQSTPNATVYVESGIVSVSDNAKISFTAASSSPFGVVEAGKSRIDLLAINSGNTLEIIPGASAVSSPSAPTYPLDKIVIAEVRIDENGTVVIDDSDITDVRPFLNIGGSSLTVREVDGSPSVSNVKTLEIDQATGIHVLDQGSNIVRLSIGSHWKDLYIDGANVGMTPIGEETLNLISGNDIDISGNSSATPKALTIALEDDLDVTALRASSASGLGLYDDGSNLGVFIKDGGNVGIGTTSPAAILDINGSFPLPRITNTDTAGWSSLRFYQNSTLLGRIQQMGSTYTDAAGRQSDLEILAEVGDLSLGAGGNIGQVYIKTTGNVGIGTTNPAQALDIGGADADFTFSGSGTHDINATGTLRIGGHAVTGTLNVSNQTISQVNTLSGVNSQPLYINSGTGAADVIVNNNNSSSGSFKWLGGGGTALVTFTNGGNVGIGATGSASKLDVQGQIYAHSSAGTGGITLEGKYGWASHIFANAYYNGANDVYRESGRSAFRMLFEHDGDNEPQYISFGGAPQGTAGGTISWSEIMRLQRNGKVGIGTTSPTANVNIKGNLNTALAGTVSVTTGQSTVTGANTAFSTELVIGDSIKIGSEIFTVSVISDNTNLTLDSNSGTTQTGITAYKDSSLFLVQNGAGTAKLTLDKSGVLTLNSTKITGLSDPISANDAATKNYVDNALGGTPGEATFSALTVTGQTNLKGDLLDTLGNLTLNDAVDISGNLAVGTDKLYVNTATGNVGIGTTNPSGALQIGNLFKVTSGGAILMDGGGGDNGVYLAINNGFNRWNNSAISIAPNNANASAMVIQGVANQAANLVEWQNSSGTGLGVINANGNVGIGTTNPALANLQVAGNMALRSADKVILDIDDDIADSYIAHNNGGNYVSLFIDGVECARIKKKQ